MMPYTPPHHPARKETKAPLGLLPFITARLVPQGPAGAEIIGPFVFEKVFYKAKIKLVPFGVPKPVHKS